MPAQAQDDAKVLDHAAEDAARAETKEASPAEAVPPRRVRRFGILALLSVAVPAVLLALAVVALSGRPIVAPDWLRNRIEAELSKQMTAIDVRVGEVSLVFESDWDPSILMRGVQVLPATGGGAVAVERINVRLAMAPLLERRVSFREVLVSGVTLTGLRQADGRLRIALGQAMSAGALQTDTDMFTFGEQLEGYLERPTLAHLTSFVIEDVTLRLEDLRARRAWTVDGGEVALRRDGDTVQLSSQLTVLGGRSYASFVETSLTTRFGTLATDFGLSFQDIPSEDLASQITAMRWLEILRAPISGALRASLDDAGNLSDVHATLQIDEGVLQPEGEVRPVPFDGMRSYLTYDPARGAIRFDELSVTSDMIRVSAFGEAFLRGPDGGLPDEFLVQLTLNEFRANPRNLEDDPIALERSFADFRLQLDPFSLDLGQLVVRQGGNQVVLDGHLGVDGAHWDYALNGQLDAVQARNVLSVWPKSFEQKPRKWVSENLRQALVTNVDLAVRSRGAALPDLYVGFQFEDAVVRAVKTMPPIQGGVGFGIVKDNKVHIAVEEGFVEADVGGRINVAGSSFIVEDIRLKPSPGHVDVVAEGPITAALSLLDREPMKLFTKAKLPVDFAPGRAVVRGTIDMLLKDNLPIEEVMYDITGDLLDVTSTHFIPDKEMKGNFSLRATPERVDIEGTGTLAGIPVDAHWHMFGGKENEGRSWLTGTAVLNAQALEVFEVGLPKGTLSEEGMLSYDMEIVRDVPPKLKLRSDLVGARLSVPPIGWRKAARTAGNLEVDITVGEPPIIERVLFEAPGLSLEGDVTLAKEGGLEVARLNRLAVGQWLTGRGLLRGRGDALPALELTGGRMDMRQMPDTARGGSSGGSGAAASGPITARLDELVVTDGIRLAPISAELSTQGGISGRFRGNFNGGPAVTGLLAPHANGTQVQVKSPQGGQIAASMGVIAAAKNGAMTLDLIPRAAKGEYDGTLSMKSVRVQQVPAMAALLNAISVVGLIDQLNGPGLFFSDVFAKFRITPGQLIVGESSAVGPSIGLSANGTYSFAKKWFDIQGTISPIYAVNVVGRPFARRGEGLIGFNYRMRGPAADTSISVNPLSALTPGFFREIFRRPPPDLSN
ncbi:AsmA-like C-terminal region-containing protein [Shimia sp. MMG029]|uniref:AsmA-like C-terminal region-containing protein n=1 Tax=Shimia sp. MMG029 TaxID=3021978 RepID=UPI0022FEAB6D|nr:AsmA-like C-terminal region-containing protein [Shimia sp. MMG029]MDA5555652.1 hypothetical protein [Shimia sp. MMG029]